MNDHWLDRPLDTSVPGVYPAPLAISRLEIPLHLGVISLSPLSIVGMQTGYQYINAGPLIPYTCSFLHTKLSCPVAS